MINDDEAPKEKLLKTQAYRVPQPVQDKSQNFELTPVKANTTMKISNHASSDPPLKH